MRRIVLCITALLSLYSTAASQLSRAPYNDPLNPPFAPGTILLKLTADANSTVSLCKGDDDRILTGIPKLDSILARLRVVTFERMFPNTSTEGASNRFTDINGALHSPDGLNRIFKLHFPDSVDVERALRELAREATVEYAEPDFYMFTQVLPNDPLADSLQWHLDSNAVLHAPQAWDITTSDTTQIIGIIDTGVDWLHPDLANKVWINTGEIPGNNLDDDADGYVDDVRGWDWISSDNNPMDDNSHGTHVAGIAAAETNNNVGIAGVAWRAKIMPLKVLQSSGYGTASDVAAAVNYAYLKGATVINLSLGSYGESLSLKTALEYAYSSCVIVAAAGNDGYKIDPPYPPFPLYAPLFPACYPWIVGVMASTSTNNTAVFSNVDPSGPVVSANPSGYNYEITAPGTNIFSTMPQSGYTSLSGTSMATPMVSGAVALLKSHLSPLSNENIMARLIQGSSNRILNIYNSLTLSSLAIDLHYVNHTLLDTLPGCDQDGRVDANETIQIYPTVKNAGGLATRVYAKCSGSSGFLVG